jgi:hypothetical protein
MAIQRITEDIDPKRLFQKGESFYFTSAYLMSQGLSVLGPTGFAAITCMAFGTEVYLKVLVQIEKGENPLDTHNLRNLFHDLPTQTQREIRRQWLKEHGKDLRSPVFRGPDQPLGFKHPKTFEEALDLSAKAFVDWRYPSAKGTGWYMSGLPPIVRERILKARPDWRPPAGSSTASLNPHPDFVKSQDYVTASVFPRGFVKMKNQPPSVRLNIRRSSNPKDGSAD